MILSGAAIAVALAALAILFLDARSVAWARTLTPDALAFFAAVTQLGRSVFYLVLAGGLAASVTVLGMTVANRRTGAAAAELGGLAFFAFASVGGAGLVTFALKMLVGRGRPMLFDDDGIVYFRPGWFEYAHASFPSGHTTTIAAVALAGFLILRWWSLPLLALAPLVALSRIAVGAHYPSDVVVGAFIGAAWTGSLALWLASRGIALRHDAAGRLRPRAVALRAWFRRGRR